MQLRTMISLRMDPRVRARIDPSDIVQEAYLEAARRYQEYLNNPRQTPYVWLRFLAYQRLLIAHREHLNVKARDARREVSGRASGPGISSEGILQCLVQTGTTPSQALMRAEEAARLHQALAQLPEKDCEILLMRHFEQMSNAETAEVLGISTAAAAQRYLRALRRVSAPLMALVSPGGNEPSAAKD